MIIPEYSNASFLHVFQAQILLGHNADRLYLEIHTFFMSVYNLLFVSHD